MLDALVLFHCKHSPSLYAAPNVRGGREKLSKRGKHVQTYDTDKQTDKNKHVKTQKVEIHSLIYVLTYSGQDLR